MSTTAKLGLRDAAERARVAAEAGYREREAAEAERELDRDYGAMVEAVKERFGEYAAGALFQRGPLLVELDDSVLLSYRPWRSSEYGGVGDEFYLAELCDECGLAVGRVVIGNRHAGEARTLVELGEALTVGVEHHHETERDDEPRAVKPTREEIAEKAVAMAEKALRDEEFTAAQAIASIAIARNLALLRDSVYWHGGER